MKVFDIIREDEDAFDDESVSDDIVVVGDSIALGLSGKIPGASVYARKGLNSGEVLSRVTQNKKLRNSDLAVIAVGSNDIINGKGNVKQLANNIKEIRNILNADRYIWVLPYDKIAANAISSIVSGFASSTDKTLPLSKTVEAAGDGVHPESYDTVADEIHSLQNQMMDIAPSGWIQHPGSNRKDPNIEKIQKLLISVETPYDLGPRGVDGVLGPYTSAAIKKFQQEHGLKATGTPTQETIDAMNKIASNLTILDKLPTKPDPKTKNTKDTPVDTKDNKAKTDKAKTDEPTPGPSKSLIPKIAIAGVGAGAVGSAGAADTNKSPAKSGNGVPKGATEDQMKQFGLRVEDKIDWHEMRSYVEKKLSFNHAVAMVINCKWESGFKPGLWVHSDNKQGPSGGLFMFHDAKLNGQGFFSEMVKACGGAGNWQSNWQGQIDFALSSTIGKGPAFASQQFKTAEEATSWFCINFERPTDAEIHAAERAREVPLYSKT